MSTVHHKSKRNLEPHMPYRCGVMTGEASVDEAWVNCSGCIDLMGRGAGHHPPLHVPPIMNDNEDGIFLFHDRHHGAGYTMEVVPQTTGNVEITIEEPGGEGHLFTLSHLDRADLLRALLHDFHYSPERGGPNDDIN